MKPTVQSQSSGESKWTVGERKVLDRLRHTRLVNEATARRLPRAPHYLMDACFAGADPAGLFKPSKSG